MPISIQIESPRGTVVGSLRLEPGQEICVAGRVTTAMNFPNSFEEVSVDIFDGFATMHWDTGTDWNGWYWIDNIVLPDIVSKATVRVGAHFAISGWEYSELNIGIGTNPAPPPGSGLDFTKLALIGSGVVIAGVLLAVMFRK